MSLTLARVLRPRVAKDVFTQLGKLLKHLVAVSEFKILKFKPRRAGRNILVCEKCIRGDLCAITSLNCFTWIFGLAEEDVGGWVAIRSTTRERELRLKLPQRIQL